jgi:hypothetical protein
VCEQHNPLLHLPGQPSRHLIYVSVCRTRIFFNVKHMHRSLRQSPSVHHTYPSASTKEPLPVVLHQASALRLRLSLSGRCSTVPLVTDNMVQIGTVACQGQCSISRILSTLMDHCGSERSRMRALDNARNTWLFSVTRGGFLGKGPTRYRKGKVFKGVR